MASTSALDNALKAGRRPAEAVERAASESVRSPEALPHPGTAESAVCGFDTKVTFASDVSWPGAITTLLPSARLTVPPCAADTGTVVLSIAAGAGVGVAFGVPGTSAPPGPLPPPPPPHAAAAVASRKVATQNRRTAPESRIACHPRLVKGHVLFIACYGFPFFFFSPCHIMTEWSAPSPEGVVESRLAVCVAASAKLGDPNRFVTCHANRVSCASSGAEGSY